MSDSEMSPKRYTKTALKEPGMFAWVMHRITGVAIILFFGWHLIDLIDLSQRTPITKNDLLPFFQGPVTETLNGIFLAVVVFHGINGFRVILTDVFPSLNRYYKAMFWVFMILAIAGIAVSVVFLVLFTNAFLKSAS